jgi:hypothetical protein
MEKFVSDPDVWIRINMATKSESPPYGGLSGFDVL